VADVPVGHFTAPAAITVAIRVVVAARVAVLLAPPRTLQVELPPPGHVEAPITPVPRRSHVVLQARIPRNGIDPKQSGWDEQSRAERRDPQSTYLGTADEQKSSRWRTAKMVETLAAAPFSDRKVSRDRGRARRGGLREGSLCFCPMAIAGNFDQILRGGPYLVG
jgi:hypothetical protein